jgi:hypothetical protein
MPILLVVLLRQLAESLENGDEAEEGKGEEKQVQKEDDIPAESSSQ